MGRISRRSRRRDRNFLLCIIIIAAIAVLQLLLALVLERRVSNFAETVIKTEAKITKTVYVYGGGYRSASPAIYETSFVFATKYNQTISAKARTSGKHVGDTITVYYNAADPYDVRIRNRAWCGLMLSLASSGLLLLLADAKLFVDGIHQNKKKIMIDGMAFVFVDILFNGIAFIIFLQRQYSKDLLAILALTI